MYPLHFSVSSSFSVVSLLQQFIVLDTGIYLYIHFNVGHLLYFIFFLFYACVIHVGSSTVRFVKPGTAHILKGKAYAIRLLFSHYLWSIFYSLRRKTLLVYFSFPESSSYMLVLLIIYLRL